ncbi:DEAD/DEAH box helicase [Natronomonas sp.]|uniref:DEAD/DEAH box helicase n=1 Tax=Natronomonas sp. TaxID=2184060 RepID=UPI0026133609|nr:DEAD/DEAH box helicase [Natronomonas sp.]
MTDDPADTDAPPIDAEAFYEVLETQRRPAVTTAEVAAALGRSSDEAAAALEALAADSEIDRLTTEHGDDVWVSPRVGSVDERLTVFEARREIVADRPAQYTRALLTQFAHLEETNREGGYVYAVREEDVWNAPYGTLSELTATVRSALGDRYEALEEWIEGQWERAHKFRLTTHEDGYVVLEAKSADLLGNVAEPRLDDGVLRAKTGDETAWVADDRTAELKRTLYEAGYPVEDQRDLETGDDLEFGLDVELRPYQSDWIARFADAGSGVLVGPPGSGKTIAALGIMADVGGETLVLVPSRELATQWHDVLLERTTLSPDRIGEYHGGRKEIRPVTIATYRTAGMDRHRRLFDSRKWGLIVYDEVHHIPSPIHRRSASLQTKHRLGLTATPVRETADQEQIYTLVGRPIGTDWEGLFDAGYVAEPEVEIRFLPWGSERHRNEYGAATGHEKRQLAATNPAKIPEIAAILHENRGSKAVVFVEYLDQGDAIAEELDVPFISGETPHARRSRLFNRFRGGDLETIVVSRVGDEGIDLPDAEVAIAASGLGGSRRQGAQRAGRTMRPVGKARMYVLATQGTTEEDFARKRTKHLAARGVRVRETPPATTGVDRPQDGNRDRNQSRDRDGGADGAASAEE